MKQKDLEKYLNFDKDLFHVIAAALEKPQMSLKRQRKTRTGLYQVVVRDINSLTARVVAQSDEFEDEQDSKDCYNGVMRLADPDDADSYLLLNGGRFSVKKGVGSMGLQINWTKWELIGMIDFIEEDIAQLAALDAGDDSGW